VRRIVAPETQRSKRIQPVLGALFFALNWSIIALDVTGFGSS
jgi:hypothetical protein